jgi:hypothetical protein
MHRTFFFAIAAVVLFTAGTSQAQYPFISAYAICSAPDSSYVIWTQIDPTADPYAYPDWVGFDIQRRAVPGCGEFETINADVIPRVIGTTTYYFGGTPPSPGTLYEYIVRPVDLDRQLVLIPAFCQPCVAYETCTPLTTPFTAGTLTDVGWAVFVMNPCPCYPPAYVENPQADAIRPYAGTGATLRLFGQPGCGTVEGCALHLEHFEIVPSCEITAASARTWGQVKIRYR